MKKVILTNLLLSLMLNFAYSQSGWILQNTGLNQNLSTVIMLDSNYYIAAGEGDVILLSTNGGAAWNYITSPLSNIIDIDFVTEETGVMITEYDLLKTTNKGYNWVTLQRNQFSSSQSDIDFINETTGFICGTDDSPVAYVIKTTDGGINWIRYWINDLGTASYLKFFDANNGVSSVCNRLHFTTNGGLNWTQSFYPVNCFNSVSSFSLSSHFAFSYSGKIYKTNNSGLNWTEQISGTTKTIRNSFFLDSLTGYAIGDSGLILRTVNGGADWTIQNSNTLKNLLDVYFFDNNIGIIAGEGGIILKTTTGGLTGVQSYSENHPEKFSLLQNYPNPFNPSTNLEFGISELGFVSLKVYDVLGNEVATLVNETKPAGIYNYQLSTVNYQLSSGIYFYSLLVDGELIDTKRMVLLK